MSGTLFSRHLYARRESLKCISEQKLCIKNSMMEKSDVTLYKVYLEIKSVQLVDRKSVV